MGVVLACPPCFLGFGFGCARFLLPVGGGGRVRLARPVPAFLCGGWVRVRAWFFSFFLLGVGWVRVRLVLAPCGGGGWVCLCVWFILGMRFPGVGRAARLLCFVRGLGVPGFLFRVRGVFWSCSRRGFRVFLFPLGASFLWFGGCRVGLGFVSPAVLLGPGSGWFLSWGLARVRVWFCLESLILAQDERWRRA